MPFSAAAMEWISLIQSTCRERSADVAANIKSLGIDRLNIEERIALVEEIWESIASEPTALPLNDSQRAELDRRIADHEASPEAVISWAEVKAAALARISE
jgi:putative addiction module component (TIGR02574 family)